MWKEEFMFAANTLELASDRKKKYLNDYIEKNDHINSTDVTLVGVYVKRDHYDEQINKYDHGPLLTANYYFESFRHFREK